MTKILTVILLALSLTAAAQNPLARVATTEPAQAVTSFVNGWSSGFAWNVPARFFCAGGMVHLQGIAMNAVDHHHHEEPQMKVTTKQVREAAPALTELAQMPLPSAVALRVMLTIRALRDPMSAFDEVWAKLLTEVGEPIKEQPGQFTINDIEKFNTESKALHEQEIEIKVKQIAFADLKPFALKAQTLLALDWLITGLDEGMEADV